MVLPTVKHKMSANAKLNYHRLAVRSQQKMDVGHPKHELSVFHYLKFISCLLVVLKFN